MILRILIGANITLSKQNKTNFPEKNIIEEGLFPRLMGIFHIPSSWHSWVIWAIGISLAILPTLTWWVVLKELDKALFVGGVHWLFMAIDKIILINLPKKRISFGPWKAIFFTLAVPRTAASLLLSLAGLWLGWEWGMMFILSVQFLGTVALIYGAIIEPHRLKMTEYQFATDRLPHGTPDIRVIHISDLHVERLTQREEKLLQMVHKAKPDLILITGDYVNLSFNRDPVTYAHLKQLLNQLASNYDVYATLGSPPVDIPDMVVPIFDDLPIPLLREDWKQIDLGQGRKLVLLGMDCTHYLDIDQARLDRLMSAAPNGVPQLLLYHSPELMPQASQYGVDLYVCGHTHGGQIRLPITGPVITGSQLGRKYVMGAYQNGRTHLYVSRGVGLEGLSAPRIRFLSPPEITLITITANGSATKK